MANNVTIKIDLLSASSNGEALQYHLDDAFFTSLEQEEIVGGDVDAVVRVKSSSSDYYEVAYTLNGTVCVLCDRCLETLAISLKTSDAVRIYVGDGEPTDLDAKVLTGRNLVYDLAWDLYETLALSLPTKRVHPGGDCNPNMLDRILLDVDQDV